MEALKLTLFIAFACFMQSQAVPAEKPNDLKPFLYITIGASVYAGDNETQVALLEIDATVSGEQNCVDITSAVAMTSSKIASIQNQPQSKDTLALGSVNNGLPLAASATVQAEVDINVPPKTTKTYGIDVTFNLWAQKKQSNDVFVKF